MITNDQEYSVSIKQAGYFATSALFVYDTHGEHPLPLGVFRYNDAEPDWATVEALDES